MTKAVDFAIEREVWNLYQLDDGTRLKIRVVVTGIQRDDDVRTADGAPTYRLDTQCLVAMDVPAALKISAGAPASQTKDPQL